MIRYDVIYFWCGGREYGHWEETFEYSEALLAEIRKGGRYAVPGKRSIGAPEGPPRNVTRW